MKTLWPFNVHTSTRSATYFTKYLSQDETYQGAGIDPHVCFYFSSIWGHSWAHTELWEHPPPPDTGTPPSQNPPGPGKGRGDESDVSERRHGRGYSAINSAISQEIGAEFDSMLWVEYFLEMETILALHCWRIAFNILIRDSYIFWLLCQLHKVYKWLTQESSWLFQCTFILNMTHWPSWWLHDYCLLSDVSHHIAYPEQSWCSGGPRSPSWPWPPCRCCWCTCTWCRPPSPRSLPARLCWRSDLTTS